MSLPNDDDLAIKAALQAVEEIAAKTFSEAEEAAAKSFRANNVAMIDPEDADFRCRGCDTPLRHANRLCAACLAAVRTPPTEISMELQLSFDKIFRD